MVLRGARLFLFPIFTCDVKNGKNIEADDGDQFPILSQIGKCRFEPLFPAFLPPPSVSPAPLGLLRAGAQRSPTGALLDARSVDDFFCKLVYI
jgi:hypothetical protein